VESHAGGRVYTGRDALERGLVDRLGGMPEAIEEVCRRAKIADPDAVELHGVSALRSASTTIRLDHKPEDPQDAVPGLEALRVLAAGLGGGERVLCYAPFVPDIT